MLIWQDYFHGCFSIYCKHLRILVSAVTYFKGTCNILLYTIITHTSKCINVPQTKMSFGSDQHRYFVLQYQIDVMASVYLSYFKCVRLWYLITKKSVMKWLLGYNLLNVQKCNNLQRVPFQMAESFLNLRCIDGKLLQAPINVVKMMETFSEMLSLVGE